MDLTNANFRLKGGNKGKAGLAIRKRKQEFRSDHGTCKTFGPNTYCNMEKQKLEKKRR
jgi:hypothetical protein